MPHEKSAGVILFREGKEGNKYLILHYESGHWDFVKGKIEREEKIEDTIRREMREETGIISFEFIPGFEKKINYFFRRDGVMVYKEVAFRLAKTTGEKVELSYEHVGSEWLSYEDAKAKVTYDNARDILRKAHHFLVEE